jgi:hypothetical protein
MRIEAAMASSENHTVISPGRRNPASYSGQLSTLCWSFMARVVLNERNVLVERWGAVPAPALPTAALGPHLPPVASPRPNAQQPGQLITRSPSHGR